MKCLFTHAQTQTVIKHIHFRWWTQQGHHKYLSLSNRSTGCRVRAIYPCLIFRIGHQVCSRSWQVVFFFGWRMFSTKLKGWMGWNWGWVGSAQMVTLSRTQGRVGCQVFKKLNLQKKTHISLLELNFKPTHCCVGGSIKFTPLPPITREQHILVSTYQINITQQWHDAFLIFLSNLFNRSDNSTKGVFQMRTKQNWHNLWLWLIQSQIILFISRLSNIIGSMPRYCCTMDEIMVMYDNNQTYTYLEWVNLWPWTIFPDPVRPCYFQGLNWIHYLHSVNHRCCVLPTAIVGTGGVNSTATVQYCDCLGHCILHHAYCNLCEICKR